MTLAEENELLRAENAWLREMMQAREDLGLRIAKRWKVRRLSGRLIAALYDTPGFLTYEQLIQQMWPGDTAPLEANQIIKVYVCYARRGLGADAIETLWGMGYQMTDAGRALVTRGLKLVPDGHQPPAVRQNARAGL